MRGLPKAIPFLIGIIALDFTLAFGLEKPVGLGAGCGSMP